MLSLTGSTTVGGTVAAGESRLVRLGDYWLDVSPGTYMLVTRHQDRPGTMGRIGQILGEADVNISAMHLGSELTARRRADDPRAGRRACPTRSLSVSGPMRRSWTCG